MFNSSGSANQTTYAVKTTLVTEIMEIQLKWVIGTMWIYSGRLVREEEGKTQIK